MEHSKKYLLIGKTLGITMEFNYDLNGLLIAFKILEGELNEKQQAWLFCHRFPYQEQQMEVMKTVEWFEVTESDPDLSFDAFWTAYGYKLGKKVQAQNAWNKLSKGERIAALAGIKPYDNYLKRRNNSIAKAYPSSYLNQRYWENDYKSTA